MSEYQGLDRRANDAQIAYLTAKVEALEERLGVHIDSEEDMVVKLDHKIDKLADAVAKNTDQLSFYRHLVFFFRSLFIILGALLAFNWLEIKEAWQSFWHHEPH